MGDQFRQKFGSHLPSAFKEEGWQDSKLQRKLAQAGYRTYTATSLLLGVTLICTLLGLAGGLIFRLAGSPSLNLRVLCSLHSWGR